MDEIKKQKILQRLEKLHKKAYWCSNLCLICGIATNISLFVLYADNKKCLLAFGIGIMITIILAGYSSKYQKRYRQIYKSTFVQEILKETFEDVTYEWEKGISGTDLYRSQLFEYKGHLSEDYFIAEYKGIKFEQADVKHRDPSKHKSLNFEGKVMVFKSSSADVPGVWIYTKKFDYDVRYKSKSLKRISITDSEFETVFDIYAIRESDAEQIVTPRFRENLLTLSKQNQAIGMCFKGSKLYVGIDTTRDTFDVKVLHKRIHYDEEILKIKKDIEDSIETIELLMMPEEK